MMKSILKLTIVGAAFALSLSNSVAQTPTYEVTHRLPVGGVSKWDFVPFDAQRNRLYLTRGDRVEVIDPKNGNPLGTIAQTEGVHGVALAQDLKLGFTSNGKSNSVTVFNLDTLQTVGEVQLHGENPDVILYEPTTKKLFVFNGKSDDFDVVDPLTLKVIATVPASGRPEFAVSDGKGRIYFNVEDKGEINVINVKTNQLAAKWKLKGCEEPTGLAMDVANARLISTCKNNVAVVTDAKTGKHKAQFAIGEHPDAAIYDTDTKTVFVSNGDAGGSVTVARQINPNRYDVIANVVTAPGAKTMAMNPQSKEIYLPTVIDGQFTVLVVKKKAP